MRTRLRACSKLKEAMCAAGALQTHLANTTLPLNIQTFFHNPDPESSFFPPSLFIKTRCRTVLDQRRRQSFLPRNQFNVTICCFRFEMETLTPLQIKDAEKKKRGAF